MPETKNIHIDARNVPNMKCWCGSEVFLQLYNLKYLSPILVGDPAGASVVIMKWACLKCVLMGIPTFYPGAIPQEEVRKYRPKMDDVDIKKEDGLKDIPPVDPDLDDKIKV